MNDLLTRVRLTVARRYAIESEIGRGGMAVVYLAKDRRHGRRVAIKVLHPELAAALGSDRFLREIQIAAILEHPHILALIDSGDADGLPYYVMPYVEGETLRDRMDSEGPLSVGEAVGIASEVADALDYAHRQGVVHRDIKPGNILLAEGHARITDFGVARAIGAATEGELTATGVAVGTPRYMSPEQAAGTEVDGRADIYSLGCVLWEMLAGAPPFSGPTPAAILAQKAMRDVPDIREWSRSVSPELARVISRAMEVEPADRYATAQEFADALERPESEKRRRRRGRGLYRRIAGVAVAVVLFGAGAWLAVRITSRTPDTARGQDLLVMAVMPFENLSGDSALDNVGRIATNVLSGALEEIDTIRVVEASRQPSGPEEMRALRARTLATVALKGSLYRTTDSLLIESRLIDTERSEILEGISASSAIHDFAAGVDALRQAVLVAVASRFNLGEEYSPSYGQAASYEAWEHLSNARELWRMGGSERQALHMLYRAIEADSTFDAALALAMIWHVNLGEFGPADSIATELEQRIADLPPRSRWQLAVQRALMARDRDALVKAFRDWKDQLPNASGYFHLAVGLIHAQRPLECLEVLDEFDPERNDFAGVRAYCHHAAGQYQQALRQARRGREEDPESVDLAISTARGLAATGQSEAAVRLIRETLSAPVGEDPEQHDLRFSLQVDVPLELRAHGDQVAAAEALERAIAWYRQRASREGTTAADRWRYARALYSARRWEDARAAFSTLSPEALATEPTLKAHNIDVSRLGYLGVISVRLGDYAVADSIDQVLATMRRRWLWGHAAYWRAAMAAAAGDSVGATERLAEALKLGLFAAPWGVEYPKWNFHIDPDFESVRAYPPFRELIQPRG